MHTVIIQGSSNSEGNTNAVVRRLQARLHCDIIDLNDYIIRQYDYAYMNQDDDFMPLIRRIADNYDLLIFATPVYWYSMSGTMKVFFDRITDCLKIEKAVGIKLKGKSMAMVSVGSDDTEYESVRAPFRLSAEYLHMHYLGDVHSWIDGEMDAAVAKRVDDFAEQLRMP